MKKITLIIIVSVVFNFTLSSLIKLNNTETAYIEEQEGTSESSNGTSSSTTLKSIIVESVNSYLLLMSDWTEALASYESGDLSSYNSFIGSAISNCSDAKGGYFNLKNTALTLAYNQSIIDKLKELDYNQIAASNGLDQFIMQTVSSFLSNGDVSGLYQFVSEQTENIYDNLLILKDNPDDPDLITSVDLKITNLFLVGNYSVIVFNSL